MCAKISAKTPVASYVANKIRHQTNAIGTHAQMDARTEPIRKLWKYRYSLIIHVWEDSSSKNNRLS